MSYLTIIIKCVFTLLCLKQIKMTLSATPPTLYEYYTSGGINSGLSVDQPYFTLNDRNITIYSGAMHYFRIPKPYWRDRLRKLRASGLNTVETYIAWNLHEPQNGQFDFGSGGSDMEQFLDLTEYLQIAQEEDLFAIVRPGPYICAEWEWGGLPSWLLREEDIRVRTSDPKYLDYVKRYFNVLLPILATSQFTLGGPIIAFQVENEYGSSLDIDLNYIQEIYDLMQNNSIEELLFTSDGPNSGTSGTLPDLLFQTINFGSDPESAFGILEEMQPNKPLMAMEVYPGWFDHWSEDHHTVSSSEFYDLYNRILKYSASVNLYMFHGGTNFGFFNGANGGNDEGNAEFQPTTTSYDYDAPLSEAGDYTEKYEVIRQLIKQYNQIEILTPDPPDPTPRIAYDTLIIDSQINYENIIEQLEIIESETILPMENLPINNNSGQSYGYLIYRKEGLDIEKNSILTIENYIRDTVMVLINGKLISPILTESEDLNGFGYWRQENSTLTLSRNEDLTNATLDLIVENWGRVNYANLYYQNKGLVENKIYLNEEEISNWKHLPMEFKSSWTKNLNNWQNYTGRTGPTLYKANLEISQVQDTFLDMQEWSKGLVIINGFVLGKYALIGPAQTLYLPGPLLHEGKNDIIIFEQFKGPNQIKFSIDPIYVTK